jgi:hypothetical protein
MEYHDGELSPPVRGEVERHLKSCTDCRRQLAEWRQVDDLVRGQPPALPRPHTGPIWLQAAVLLLTAGFALLQARPNLATITRHYEIHHGAQTYTVETSGSNTTLLMLEVEDEDGLAQAHIGGDNL